MSATQTSLAKSGSFSGQWWLPTNPDARYAGQLTFVADGGAKLVLFGAFNPPEWGTNDLQILPLVNGITVEGKQLTLQTVITVSQQSGFPADESALTQTVYQAKVAFLGILAQNVDELQFISIVVRYPDLPRWVERVKSETSFQGDPLEEVTVRHQFPKPSRLTIGALELSFATDISLSFSVETPDQINVQAHAKLSLGTVATVDELLRHAQIVGKLLSLASGRSNPVVEVIGSHPQHFRTLGNGTVLYDQIDIIAPNIQAHSAEVGRNAYSFLFDFNSLKPQLERYLNNWFLTARDLEPVLDLFFATRSNESLYLEAKVLNLTQALEAYHRRRFVGQYQPTDEYEKSIVKAVVAALPQDMEAAFKQSFRSHLRHAHEYSLRKRLHQILDWLSENWDPKCNEILGIDDNFVGKVVDTRNFLTHWPSEAKSTMVSTEEMHKLTIQLDIILEILLLHELGLEASSIFERMNFAGRFRKLRDWLVY